MLTADLQRNKHDCELLGACSRIICYRSDGTKGQCERKQQEEKQTCRGAGFIGALTHPVPPEPLTQGGSLQEVEEAIQVLQASTEGGARDAPAVAGSQLACHLCCLGSGALNHLSLIQAHSPPAQASQRGRNHLCYDSHLCHASVYLLH